MQAAQERSSYAANPQDQYAPHPGGPPSEHGSYRPDPRDAYPDQGPPSEHGSYRADPYAKVGQFDRYGDEGNVYDQRGPPDGVDPHAPVSSNAYNHKPAVSACSNTETIFL